MKKLFFLFLALPLFSTAQVVKYSNEFLTIGTGARGLAMGGAVSTLSKDASSVFWNPAGLAYLSHERQVALMHSEYFAGIANYDFGALAFKLDDHNVLGLSLVRFGIDNIPNTLRLIDQGGNINYSNVSTFSAADYAFITTYSHKNKKGFSMGGNAKIIRRVVGDFGGAWGFGLDFGIRQEVDNWVFAVNGKDITSTFNAWKFNNSAELIQVFQATGNEIPQNAVEITLPSFVGGISRKFALGTNFELLPAIDVLMTTDGKRNTLIRTNFISLSPQVGFELGYKEIVFLRGGANNFQKQMQLGNPDKNEWLMQPNIGAGVKLGNINLDYAFTNVGNGSGFYSHVISLMLGFNRK